MERGKQLKERLDQLKKEHEQDFSGQEEILGTADDEDDQFDTEEVMKHVPEKYHDILLGTGNLSANLLDGVFTPNPIDFSEAPP